MSLVFSCTGVAGSTQGFPGFAWWSQIQLCVADLHVDREFLEQLWAVSVACFQRSTIGPLAISLV